MYVDGVLVGFTGVIQGFSPCTTSQNLTSMSLCHIDYHYKHYGLVHATYCKAGGNAKVAKVLAFASFD